MEFENDGLADTCRRLYRINLKTIWKRWRIFQLRCIAGSSGLTVFESFWCLRVDAEYFNEEIFWRFQILPASCERVLRKFVIVLCTEARATSVETFEAIVQIRGGLPPTIKQREELKWRGEAEHFLTTFEVFRDRGDRLTGVWIDFSNSSVHILRENAEKVGLIYVISSDLKPCSTSVFHLKELIYMYQCFSFKKRCFVFCLIKCNKS